MRWFLLGVVLFLGFALIAFLYFSTSTFPYQKPPRPALVDALVAGSVGLETEHITYVLNELGVYQLHNPPLSSDTPKIEIVLGERVFGAEVVAGTVNTKEKSLAETDMRIVSSEEEIVEAIRSGDVKSYIKKSITDGKTRLEQSGSYSRLFSKGYLNLYNELTGQGMTGNIVKIFSEG